MKALIDEAAHMQYCMKFDSSVMRGLFDLVGQDISLPSMGMEWDKDMLESYVENDELCFM